MDSAFKNKICGLVTLYNPQENYLLNISTFSRFLDRLFVVDNSPAEQSVNHAALLQRFPNAVLLSTGKNLGIATAINLGIKAALKHNAHWLLTMDQDSYFCPLQAERFFCSVNFVDKERAAILSPQHNPTQLDDGPCSFEETEVAWTSGNLLNLELIQKIGLFDEKLFIDSVDHDYCFRVNLSGFKVLQATNCYLVHPPLGEKSSGNFLGKKKNNYDTHSPKRMYFIIRNGLYLSRKYKSEYPVFIKKHQKHIRKYFIKSLKYSDRRTEYLQYCIRAVNDYRHGIFGNPVDI